MKKSFFWFWILLAGLSLTTARVGAVEEPKQDPDYEDKPAEVSVADLENLSNRISDLAKYAKVGVLLQVQYTTAGGNTRLPKGFSAPIKASTVTGQNYFDLFAGKRAELSLFGDLAEKKIAYRVQYDPLGSATAKAGVSSSEQLKDYWIKASYINFVDVQFGQFKYAQALEGRSPSGELDFANTALVTTALEARRDLSFQVSGSKIPVGPIQLEYAAAIVQGSGQNNVDNNENKDAAARVGITLTDPDFNIYLGGSAYLGTEAYPGPVSVVAAILQAPWDRNNTGLEARVNIGKLKLQGEYIQGQLEPGNNYSPWSGLTVPNAKLSNPQGWYVTASYRLEDWRFGIRGESYNADTTQGSNFNWNNDVLTAGVDWFQGKDKFKLSLNFEGHFGQYEALIGQAQVNI
jgi:hypothetical protein